MMVVFVVTDDGASMKNARWGWARITVSLICRFVGWLVGLRGGYRAAWQDDIA
jgi:hypothetical protein